MLGLQRLAIERQRNVGAALADIFKKKTTYTPEVVERAKVVIDATAALKAPEGPSMFTIDVATDSVVTALYRILDDWEKALPGDIVPLDASKQAALEAVETLRDAWFGDGIGFIRDTAGVQCDALLEIRKTLSDPPVKAAIKTLGIGLLVEHLTDHTTAYAKKLGLTADKSDETPESAASQAWHDAFVLFAASVMVAYADDATARKALLGAYEQQLAEHRAQAKKERRRQREKKAAAAKDAEAKKGAP